MPAEWGKCTGRGTRGWSARFLAGPGRARQPHNWTPDGRTLFASDLEYPPLGFPNFDVVAVSGNGTRQATPLLRASFNEFQPSLSPDGRWLAYVSDESGRDEVYVRPYPALDAKFPVSADGGEEPLWSPSGRELFYRVIAGQQAAGSKTMAVEIAPGERFRAGKPRLLFQIHATGGARYGRQYDVSPDGRRFLMLRMPYAVTADRVSLVLDWPGLLKRR